jgi:hypothetical protein
LGPSALDQRATTAASGKREVAPPGIISLPGPEMDLAILGLATTTTEDVDGAPPNTLVRGAPGGNTNVLGPARGRHLTRSGGAKRRVVAAALSEPDNVVRFESVWAPISDSCLSAKLT